MNCPHCLVKLQMTERRGIEVDYCPKCRGVWLDRGELDKLLEPSYDAPRAYGTRDDDDYKEHHKKGFYKKKSFLKEIFDF